MKEREYSNYLDLVNSFNSKEKKGNLALTSFDTDVSVSYGELYEKIRLFYSNLQDVSLGDKVVVQGLNSIDWSALYFSVILRGGVLVPLDTRVSKEFREEIVRSLNPKLVILNSVEGIIKNDTEIVSFENNQNIDALAQIIFTSGTWSIPKGVMLSQKSVLRNAYQVLSVYNHKKEDTSLAILPLSHAYQQTVGYILPLISGSHIVFLESIDSIKLVQALSKFKITTMLVAPKVLELIRNSILRKIKSIEKRAFFVKCVHLANKLPQQIRRFMFAPVRKKIGPVLENLIVGGAMLNKELDSFFEGLGYNVIVGYGLSETSPVVSISLGKRKQDGSVGKILDGIEYQKSDLGELLVKGDNLFLGYWPDYRTEEYFNTKDIVDVSNGNLQIKGRTKDLIIYPSGDKIFTEDLEYIIKKNHDFEEVCVVHKTEGDKVQVYCAVKHNGLVEPEKVLNEIHSKIPSAVKIQSMKVFNASDFPYTHTLKPNKKKILEIFTN